MSLGPWQLVIIALIILVLFGRGRISEMMGDFGKGIKSFKSGMAEEVDRPVPPRIEQQPAAAPSAQTQQQMARDPLSAPPAADAVPAAPPRDDAGRS